MNCLITMCSHWGLCSMWVFRFLFFQLPVLSMSVLSSGQLSNQNVFKHTNTISFHTWWRYGQKSVHSTCLLFCLVCTVDKEIMELIVCSSHHQYIEKKTYLLWYIYYLIFLLSGMSIFETVSFCNNISFSSWLSSDCNFA